MNSWGKPYAPFLNNKRSNSGQVEVKYRHPRLQGWEFTGAVAADAGSLYGDNVGLSLSVCKRGFKILEIDYLYWSHKADAMMSCVLSAICCKPLWEASIPSV